MVEADPISFAVAPTSPFDLVDSDMLPVIEPATSLKKAANHHLSGSRRARGSTEEASQEESMRVMYEDPGLADERKKLMDLLKTQTQENQSKDNKASESIRRSKRPRKDM